MSVDESGDLTVMDCQMRDGSKAIVSFSDMGKRMRNLGEKRFMVYTSRIRLTPITSDRARCKTRYSRVPLDLADLSGDPAGYRRVCDEAVMESLGIDLAVFFAGL